MERKFKIGDRVKDKSTGLSCDVVYVHEDSDLPYLIVSKTTGGVCINWRRSEQIELIPIKKLPEPKFNPYDKVRVNIKNFTPFNAEVTAWFICGDHYLYELKTEDGGTIQSKGEGVELIEPKYKSGDKVWRKESQSIWEFVCYQENNEVSIKKSNTFIFLTTLESDIEPYTGQDKVKEETQKERNSRLAAELIDEVTRLHPELKSTHPYTVILKSGVKVGVSQGIAIAMIASMDSESCKRINDSEYFLHSEIAAIVPTENIVK